MRVSTRALVLGHHVEEWERVHAVNVRSVFLCGRAAAEHVQIPVSLREQLHLKVPDASGIAYRRFLGRIAGVAPFMP